MLADTRVEGKQTGQLGPDIYLPHTSIARIIEFIASQLPTWRDRSDRPSVTSENELTNQLCSHLNGAARRAGGFDFLQFTTEKTEPDHPVRKIDLAASPCNATIWIEGKRHTEFDTILPIECKRLPTPLDPKRDEREYVINRKGSTGGIQRFKAGHHGKQHTIAAMVAYVQQDSIEIWNKRIAEWIADLVAAGEDGWSEDDFLSFKDNKKGEPVAILVSRHMRSGKLGEIMLTHVWITMN